MIATHVKHEPVVPVRHLNRADHLSRQYGGLVVIEYLMELFGNSPKKIFNRIDVLAVLDAVRKDRDLFPEAVMKAAAKPRRGSSPN